ncbi:cytochrome c oxidase subunit I [Kyrpidia spormannii]|uniref:Cytochrome c oxidase subunit 1 n=1 Tax=Kyrpidia spormannii TaxID=2055160 RepID=A0A2K8N425_9BACL|nr:MULTISPECIES: cytochrome c oxidase subunit I [Kyrpidia]ATY84166.1 cytochrome c oxidase subunit I [Kyrpidia spormannii]MCL6576455.1 cytochrome c oxidase subunit I [Kyrpidia sp.]
MAKPLEEVLSHHVHTVEAPHKRHWLLDYLSTVDHKKIGIMYVLIGVFYLLVGGVEALLMRIQLFVPNNQFVSYPTFNELFTMHGTNMIFFAAMPLIFGLVNLIMPVQIGARDVAFPFMNAVSLWFTFVGALLVNISWFFGPAPSAGWFAYTPIGLDKYTPGTGMDFYVIGLQIAGFGSLMGAINFIATILNMRAPGMTLLRMPLFTWTSLVTSGLIVFGFPPLTVGLFLYMFERLFGGHFFDATMGGNPLLWTHLFWIFGHPEVYIVVLPAFGMISEVVATFSRKRIFGYTSMVIATVLIGFIGFMVWVHHMFTVGLGAMANSIFAISTMLIGIPTGMKVFNWLFTMWGGQIRFKPPMMFALGFLPTFVIGGFTGVMLAAAPADFQYHGSYFVVAHFHYTLIGGVVFGFFAGLYYWFPKITGRMMSEVLGHINFWLMFIGFHLTFFPMHLAGLFGMPRRVPTYNPGMGLEIWNQLSTIGAFIMGVSMIVFAANVVYAFTKGKVAGADPWDARTLEWAVPSPIPEYNFAQTPLVRGLDPLWIAKEEGSTVPAAEPLGPIHMPSNSFLPLVMAVGLFIAGFAAIYHRLFFIVLGLEVIALAMFYHSLNDDEGHHILPEESTRVREVRA